jgi:DNA (cytosine-5)-methyltransferase 1
MRVLDLFCCQGGAGYGYYQAGFDVMGVDIDLQPRHWGKVVQDDAIEFLLACGHKYDLIHASPPCQKYSQSSYQFRLMGKEYPDLVQATRAALIKVGKPYVLENVPKSPLINPVVLCGAMFDLPTYRHRLFETNWNLPQPLHLKHVAKNAKMGRMPKEGEFIQYVGHFPGVNIVRDFTGCHWMDCYGLAQSIPPQYTKYIGQQFLKTLNK